MRAGNQQHRNQLTQREAQEDRDHVDEIEQYKDEQTVLEDLGQPAVVGHAHQGEGSAGDRAEQRSGDGHQRTAHNEEAGHSNGHEHAADGTQALVGNLIVRSDTGGHIAEQGIDHYNAQLSDQPGLGDIPLGIGSQCLHIHDLGGAAAGKAHQGNCGEEVSSTAVEVGLAFKSAGLNLAEAVEDEQAQSNEFEDTEDIEHLR